MKLVKFPSKEFEKICNRQIYRKKRIREKVSGIIENVRLYGDEAITKYTKKFDKVKLLPRQLRVTESETNGAYQNIDTKLVDTLKTAIQNVTNFYKKEIKRPWKMKDEDGVILGEKYDPVDRVGIYIPSGTAPLVSTVYMTVLPAKMAGVKSIVLASPPNKYGTIDSHILAVANLLKVNEIYKVGGAQAIAALALGTKTIPRVDKIIGPGNQYVTEAKRQLFGYVDIDMLAGPSEIAIIANRHSNPDFIKSDLEAQNEHLQGLSILVTTSKAQAKFFKKEVASGFVILVKNLEQAIDAVNKLSPEHLEILMKNPKRIIKKIRNCGAIFLGPYAPVVIGDYIAGPSHVLPTAGTARFFSGLGIDDFIRRTHIVSYSKKALEKIKDSVETISQLEGLNKHTESIKIRF